MLTYRGTQQSSGTTSLRSPVEKPQNVFLVKLVAVGDMLEATAVVPFNNIIAERAQCEVLLALHSSDVAQQELPWQIVIVDELGLGVLSVRINWSILESLTKKFPHLEAVNLIWHDKGDEILIGFLV